VTGVDDIHQIRNYFTKLNIPITEDAGRGAVTPQMIGGFYDRYLAQLSPEDAASQFMNYGYWYEDTCDNMVAQANLMEKVISRMPNRSGNILDVACGTGATTRHLNNYWNANYIHGINISKNQISKCQQNSGCRNFAVMDAGAMAFGDNSFDNIICIEAAFHFDTRQAFLTDCVRILRKNGVLALTDILLHEDGHQLLPMWLRSNFVRTLPDYRALLRDVGFARADVIDITEVGWRSFARHRFSTLYEEWMSGLCDFLTLQNKLVGMYRLAAAHKYNLMCFAIK
jgi:ubiquinone/menaquinone biosynthesis C-methylase UbiE